MINKLIYTKQNSLDKQFCENLISKFVEDKTNTYDGLVGPNGTLNTNVKKSKDLSISKSPGWQNEDQFFRDLFNKEVVEYSEYLNSFGGGEFGAIFSPGNPKYTFDLGYFIRSYEPNDGYFNWHNDFVLDEEKGFRILTLIWYLNDVEEGGETEFFDGTLIKPETGKLIVFPTSWYISHRGKTPISNTKYIVTSWLHAKYW